MGFFVATVLGLFGFSQSVAAVASDPNHYIGSDNTFYAYVKAGEKLTAESLRSPHRQNQLPVDVIVTLDGPGVEQQKCTLKKTVALGKGCEFTTKTVEKSGIWRLNFVPGEGAKAFEEASPDVRWGANLFTWKIAVTSNEGEQKGRVWSERYAFRQPPGDADKNFTSDFTTYYVSEDGYIYKAINYGYNGQLSIQSADSIGVRKNDECISAYQSAHVDHRELAPALGSCGNRYKLFFEEPAGNLPAEAERWDGEMEWIRPNIKKPTVSELHFNPDETNDQLSGNITFYLKNFIGQYQVKIDVDNDGSFDGQDDVAIFQQMRELSNNLQSVRYQGVDKTGQIVFKNQKIGIRVEITRVAEIHFVAVDVEGRKGLELVRLNGENAPNRRLCWNDTELPALEDIAYATTEIDGRSCPDSTGGIHGWAYDNASWGNARYVDDWVYASAKVDGSNTIVYPEDEATHGGNGAQSLTAYIVAGVAVVAIVAGVSVAIILRKRKNRNYPPASTPTGVSPQTPSGPANGGDVPPNPPIGN